MRKGLYTALITPFGPSGELNEPGIRQLIQMQLKAGVDGIVVLGTTGEAPTLSPEEKEKIIRIARAEIDNDTLLVVGTGSYCTKKTIEDTQKAKDLGADAALVVTPYYNKPTQAGLYSHFEALAKAVDLPLLLYNVQGRTGQNLQTETLKHLAEIPKIIGVKEASGNIVQIMEVIEQILPKRPDFLVFSGDDNLTFPTIALGGHGVISVLSNLMPNELVQFVRQALKEDSINAREMHYKLLPFFKALFLETNPIPIKAMLNDCELPAGPCRLPLTSLSEENQQKLNSLLMDWAKPLALHG